jgi:hypothetical protein
MPTAAPKYVSPLIDRLVPADRPTGQHDPWNTERDKDDQPPVRGQSDGERGGRPGEGIEQPQQRVQSGADRAGVVPEHLQFVQQLRRFLVVERFDRAHDRRDPVRENKTDRIHLPEPGVISDYGQRHLNSGRTDQAYYGDQQLSRIVMHSADREESIEQGVQRAQRTARRLGQT